jgi:hypothetical protein
MQIKVKPAAATSAQGNISDGGPSTIGRLITARPPSQDRVDAGKNSSIR